MAIPTHTRVQPASGLRHHRLRLNQTENAIYFSADSPIAKTSSIYEIIEEAYRTGYKTMLVDEIHKYPGWVEESKSIYDDFPVQMIASGSSTAAIKKGSLSLGRRAIEMNVPNLSFGEFVYMKSGQIREAPIECIMDIKKKRDKMAC